MDLKEIQNLIKFVANSGVAEVKLETGDVKLPLELH
jgi:acetyl-CoA carboxylase biotin carboxyl carrier protein